jgi:hypothetical protein
MGNEPKISKCTFVIIKFNISGKEWYVMRRDNHWKDVNFIGGHEIVLDKGSRKRTAKRELLEEVPAFRKLKAYKLSPLTQEMEYGPIYSRSAGCKVQYLIQFFLLSFIHQPDTLFKALRGRTLNILLSQSELIDQNVHRISGLVRVLANALPDGLNSIPYSWHKDLEKSASSNGLISSRQIELTLNNTLS